VCVCVWSMWSVCVCVCGACGVYVRTRLRVCWCMSCVYACNTNTTQYISQDDFVQPVSLEGHSPHTILTAFTCCYGGIQSSKMLWKSLYSKGKLLDLKTYHLPYLPRCPDAVCLLHKHASNKPTLLIIIVSPSIDTGHPYNTHSTLNCINQFESAK